MQLRLRNATQHDLDGIYACAEKFAAYAGYEEQHGMPFDEASFKDTVLQYIENGICILAVDGDIVKGGVCGMVMPWGFNDSIKIALELFYWMDEDSRGTIAIRMLAEYEKRVAAAGAKSIMIQPETPLTEKVGKMYERRGYVPFERFWIKNDR